MEHDGIDNTTERRSGSCETHGRGNLGAEVRRKDGDSGNKQASTTNTDTDGLSKNDLIVARAERKHHLSEYDKERSHEHEGVDVSSVINRASDRTDKHQKEGLDTANP